MKIISLFNNKGGVGKTTLAFHLSNVLAEMGKKVLIIDLDPQCNITILGINQDKLEKIWNEEDSFINDFRNAFELMPPSKKSLFKKETRSIHYLLKPTEDGVNELDNNDIPPPIELCKNLSLIPGRLTLNKYESAISERWSQAYLGNPLALRTITQIRKIAEIYGKKFGFDFVIMDTSPSLGILNKVVISTVDAFIVPCLPDMFSLYGIRNIGESLSLWQKEFKTIYGLIPNEKRMLFPKKFVQFLGYTIYNAKKYTGKTSSPWNLAKAHMNYANKIPDTIRKYIVEEVRQGLNQETISKPIGDTAVMHTHNTLPNMAQKYRIPIWKIPDCDQLDDEDKRTIKLNAAQYRSTFDNYKFFACDFLKRLKEAGL